MGEENHEKLIEPWAFLVREDKRAVIYLGGVVTHTM